MHLDLCAVEVCELLIALEQRIRRTSQRIESAMLQDDGMAVDGWGMEVDDCEILHAKLRAVAMEHGFKL